MPALVPVVLSGGEGTRLWPLSTSSTPKQFGDVVPGGSLFSLALRRLDGRPEFSPPLVVTGRSHLAHVMRHAHEAGVDLGTVITEPAGRNTAPAALAAALSRDPSDVLVILPSDHLISDTDRFGGHVLEASSLAEEGHLVTFGVVPTRVETGYGYIEPGAAVGPAFAVKRFVEKPEEAAATEMVEGGYLWNSGMFVVGAGALLGMAAEHCPDVLEDVAGSMSAPDHGRIDLDDRFSKTTPLSIDVAIAEKTDMATVIPIDVGWSDIGSYESLWSVMERDENANATSGATTLIDVRRSLVRSTSRLVAVAGLDDVVVVETEEAVLVTRRDRSQAIRDVVASIGSDSESHL